MATTISLFDTFKISAIISVVVTTLVTVRIVMDTLLLTTRTLPCHRHLPINSFLPTPWGGGGGGTPLGSDTFYGRGPVRNILLQHLFIMDILAWTLTFMITSRSFIVTITS